MNILYFAPIPYDDMKQRPQFIAEALAKKHKVWYVEPTDTFMRCILKGGDTYKAKRNIIDENLEVIRLNGALSIHIKLKVFDVFGIGALSEKQQLRNYISSADVIWVGSESWGEVLSKITGKTIVYDKMDDNVALTKSKLIREFLKKEERKVLHYSDIIIVTANVFYNNLKDKYPQKRIEIIPNAVGFIPDLDRIKTIQRKSKRKIFGYIGTINHWFDTEAVRLIAQNNPECDVMLVGPNYLKEIDMPNVIYCGKVDIEKVPQYINMFDVCLYPFKKNELLDTINPVKLYEYLALNKPVVAVKSIETEKFSDVIYLYDDYDTMLEICSKELNEPFISSDERNSFFENHSWNSRVNEILRILNEGV